MPDKVEGTVFWENRMGDYKLAYDEQTKNFYLLVFKVLSAYMDNTLNSPKKPEKFTYHH